MPAMLQKEKDKLEVQRNKLVGLIVKIVFLDYVLRLCLELECESPIELLVLSEVRAIIEAPA